jgi:hypothetical protein
MSNWMDDRVTRGDQPCPWCNEKNDASMWMGDVKEGEPKVEPKPGDVGICASCAMPMIYQEYGKPRPPVESEWMALNADDNITRIRRAVFMSNVKSGANVVYEDHDLYRRGEGTA